MPEILLVEDTPMLSELYVKALENAGHVVRLAQTGHQATLALQEHSFALVLLDLHLPDMNGIDILRQMKTKRHPATVIVITAYSSINVAVEAMREGAQDFLAKPFPIERLVVTVRNALETLRLSRNLASLRDSAPRDCYQHMVGSSPIMQSVYRIIENVASSNAPVFITGESGTGKEVCAEAIHAAGARRNKPFIAMNCAAIPRELMESEIFGHVKGAFTGAIGPREGAAMAADGGTLFMDEICEMELPLQAKLLRFLQTFTITPVGTNRPQRVDVRIIAATNRNPMAEVEAGRFREDLYYRLHVVPLALPTLAERDDDVIEIARSFLIRYAKEEQKPFEAFSEEVEERLRRYSWPGNIRQLQNVVRNIVVLHSASVVTLDMLPPPLDSLKEELAVIGKIRPLKLLTRDSETTEAIKPLWQIERGAIEHAVDLCDGNIPRAAALLEVSPSTIYRKRMVWTSGNPSGEAQTAT